MTNRDHHEQALRLGFIYEGELVDAEGKVLDRFVDRNIIPQAGINHIVGLIRGEASLLAPWYVGVYEGNYVPNSATSSADLQAGAQESVSYSETARPEWVDVYDGVQLIGNLASRAEFTFTAAKRLYGGFLCSNAGKGGNSGVLLSIARFASPYDVPAGSTFRLGVSISIVPAS
ncbi:hypothetical protein QN399_15990 [Pseudomonas sp. 10C3]|uniref:hypothetical protein n=1 Tax=Pseudomonas sp. 10C3 TaxID=3118753 RepID=UPI002E8238F0|nr:hypothetical protein [Pseudomonas sp. 10C3]MEE3507738.1 hypothetical protein [Pseudomonas sp. 10C3]